MRFTLWLHKGITNAMLTSKQMSQKKIANTLARLGLLLFSVFFTMYMIETMTRLYFVGDDKTFSYFEPNFSKFLLHLVDYIAAGLHWLINILFWPITWVVGE